MATRKNGDGDRRKKKDDEELKKLYAKRKKEFTAADLQKYTVEEEGIPFEQVVAECVAIHREYVRKHKGK